jgi:hypothetical protein
MLATKITFPVIDETILSVPSRTASFLVKRAETSAQYAWESYVLFVFEAEGTPAWKGLKPVTVQDRIRRGFPGEHPILRRSGFFRNELLPKIGTGKTEVTKSSTRIKIKIGINDLLFKWHQEGTRFMPARPIAPNTSQLQESLCNDLADKLHGYALMFADSITKAK